MIRRRVFSLLSSYSKPTSAAFYHSHSLPPYSPLKSAHHYLNANTVPRVFSLFTRYESLRSYGTSLLALNDLRDPGKMKPKKRVGRGIGSGKGKTCGRGHKGQKARGKVRIGFEGGQTPLHLRIPKRGFKNKFRLDIQSVSLGKLARFINAGKIDSHELITIKTLWDAGAISRKIRQGVRLFGGGAEEIKWPIHVEVSRVTATAKAAVEARGGSVRRVYYNKLAMKALLKPEWFEKKKRAIPRSARPPPKQWDRVDSVGRLPAPTKPIPFVPGEVKPPFPPPPPPPDVPMW